MQIPQIPADKAIPLAERLLAIFHEVREIAAHPPSDEETAVHGLTRAMLASRYLVEAREAIAGTTEFPRLGGDPRATSISRDSIRMMVEGDIGLLSRYVVAAKLADSRGGALPPDAAGRVILTAALTIASLLATPNLSPEPQKEDSAACPTSSA